ncbi:DUF1684 domain-containing protein [Pseudochryseolinea flava]|uniref:DUF1684 domain-containing protein n=1 Tax=Pseudochryseolinea flava TaxID=2059302 RepID=A0A364XZX3_9BACT|nr:DUF1684 domain-containing protein [Pseudochryseolinea flava]RAV99880.1 DUF1684 domain-containing protein [Pseudochryseolinea flava]
MKSKHVTIVVVVVALLVIVFYSFTGSDGTYEQQITQERVEKDKYLRTADDSPFKGKTDQFKGLNYFPPDPQYNVVADLTPIQQKKTIVLGTSDGKEEHYLEYAYADFNLHGKSQRLLILELMEMGPNRGKLFLAFADETSANETYGAGRYLDVSRNSGSNSITLDFNKTYNPYCAYDDGFSCPFPPKENLLTIAIRAGEKNYK